MSETAVDGETVELLRQLIRNGCVNDGADGSERTSAEVLAQVLGGAGLDVELVESEPGRASLVARIEGSDPEAPSLAYVGHTDVVPASPEGWLHDPFGGDLEAGYVWGRGAVDMLNLTASMVVALRRLAASNFRPRGSISVLAVADEEAGGLKGAGWLLEHYEQLAKADYVITESGGNPSPRGDDVLLPVMVAEKGIAWSRLVVHGTPGHGSRPFRSDNALVKAAEVVQRLAAFRPDAVVTPPWAAFVEGMGLPAALADPARVEETLQGLEDVRLARLADACTHLTISPNVVRGGAKTNIIPDRVELEVDVRTLPGQGGEEVRELLVDALGPLAGDVEISLLQDQAASSSPPGTPLWEAMEEVARTLVPRGRLVPTVLTGGTDARFWRERGGTAYGFGLFSAAIPPAEYEAMFHGRNERIDVASLGLSARLFEDLARRFCG